MKFNDQRQIILNQQFLERNSLIFKQSAQQFCQDTDSLVQNISNEIEKFSKGYLKIENNQHVKNNKFEQFIQENLLKMQNQDNYYKQIEKEKNQLQKDLENFKQKSDIVDLKNQFEIIKKDNESLFKQLIETNTLSPQVQQQKTEIVDLQKQFQQIKQENNNLKLAINKQNSFITPLTPQIQQQKNEIIDIQKQFQFIKQDNENLQVTLKEHAQFKQATQTQIQQVITLIQEVKQVVVGYQFYDDSQLILQEHYSLFYIWLKKDISLKLIYRASRDGWTGANFHTKCDDQGPTVVVIRSEFGKIFGGYANTSWDSSGAYKNDQNCFLFSLTYKQKLTIKPDMYYRSIFCANNYGPTFGGGNDICIFSNANTPNSSSSNLGHTYELPANTTLPPKEYLAGAFKFKVTEIEVFKC